MDKMPIGAKCVVKWSDDGLERAYISFGQWDEDNNVDSYGVDDDMIFFYAHGGIEQLEEMREGYLDGFNIVEYDLVHDKNEVWL